MGFLKRDRVFQVSAEESNYAGALTPNDLQSQPATGDYEKKKPEPKKQKPVHNVPPPHPSHQPLQQLATSYNNTSRPLPQLVPLDQTKPQQNVVYHVYVQSPPPQTPVSYSIPGMPYAPNPPHAIHVQPPPQQLPLPTSTYPHPVNHPNMNYYYDPNHSPVRSNVLQSNGRKSSNHDSPTDNRYRDHLHTRHLQQQQQHHTRHSHNHSFLSNGSTRGDSVNSTNFDQRSDGKANRKPPPKIASSSSGDSNYDNFVNNRKKNGSSVSINSNRSKSNRTLNGEELDVYETKSGIYSTPSFPSQSSRVSKTQGLKNSPLLPNIGIEDIEDIDNSKKHQESFIIDEFDTNLLNKLRRINDSELPLNNSRLYEYFKRFCTSSSQYMTLDELRVILSDPYRPHIDFSLENTDKIVRQFSSSSSRVLDFPSFVKMCKFLKGCYSSFDYYDSRGNDHCLDVEEFRIALQHNKLSCPPDLFYKYFSETGKITIEGYIMVIMDIRRRQ